MWKPRKIPLRFYLAQVSVFFTVSIVNNHALHYDVPLPLHMIFRSGSLIANVLLGYLLLRRRTSVPQLAGVLLVTVGISAATLAKSEVSAAELSDAALTPRTMIGLAMLTAALLLFALLGIMQEYTYTHYGKHPIEALFYSHALALPCFALVADDIRTRVVTWAASPAMMILGVPVPSMYVYLVGNMVTQLMCITGVFRLTGASNSLTMTLTISVRKFVSLVISVVYFQYPFTAQHWLGSACVFLGTLLYSLWRRPSAKAASAKTKKTE